MNEPRPQDRELLLEAAVERLVQLDDYDGFCTLCGTERDEENPTTGHLRDCPLGVLIAFDARYQVEAAHG